MEVAVFPLWIVGAVAFFFVIAAGSIAGARREEMKWHRSVGPSGPRTLVWMVLCVLVVATMIVFAYVVR